MGNCLSCGHEYERHLFGGACFYCDCKRAVYETSTVLLRRHGVEKQEPSANGTGEKKKGAPRLGNK